jgi:hypothetical protein
MTKTLITFLFAVFATANVGLSDDKALSVRDLNTAKIVGELGVPLHTVHEVKCTVVDMSFTRTKEDDGRLALLNTSVDGKAREGKHYIDIPVFARAEKPHVGKTYHFWAYETVEAAGYPSEAFEKLGIPSFATHALHFRSKLVVLKQFDPKSTPLGK